MPLDPSALGILPESSGQTILRRKQPTRIHARRPDQAPGPVRPLRTSRPLVLIVDDDADTRAMYSEYLKAMGCLVSTAKDGSVAIEKALALSPDVITMDLAMPGMDGWTAASQIKSSMRTAQIPIIALSAVETARDSARESGCVRFLAKPCLPELLWWHIRDLLGNAD